MEVTVLKKYAYDRLKEMIVNGDLMPSEPLVEDKIADLLDISKTPLREAIQRLEVENLIVRLPNRRLIVAPISDKELKELFELRSCIEGLIVKEIVHSITESDIQELEFYAEFIENLKKQGDYARVVEGGNQFHNKIYSLSDNETIKQILFQLNDRVMRYRILMMKMSNESSIKSNNSINHSKIVEKIKERNPEAAEEVMKKHILDNMETAIKEIKKTGVIN